MISTLLILCDTFQQTDPDATSFWNEVGKWGGLASIIALIIAVLGIIKKFTNARNWRRKYINSNIFDNVLYQYLPEDNTSKTKKTNYDNIQTNSSYKENIESDIYIQPYIKTPDNNPTPFFQLKRPELLRDFFINKVFVRGRDTDIPNHYYLLGDSGSGKTNALVRLFYDYLHHYKHDYTAQEKKDCLPFNIRIFSLRNENVLDSIINDENVEKSGCILFLDALDENPMAQKPKESKEYKSFIQQLEKVYTEFAFVITTCRPQFFSEEKEIPDTHNIAKIELVPFNNNQIDEFLDKTFNISNEAEKRSKAINLIDNHHEIAKRPIILTYIRDLVDTDRKLNTSLDFYDTIAESELRRNISRIQQYVTAEQIRQWWNMTSDVAGYMYKHGKTEISYEELRDFLIQHGIDHPDKYINEDHFQRRSLLTRTGNAFHFSHKSFYEYFMAYRFLQYPEEIKQVYGMDFALQIYNDSLQALFEQKDSPFAKLKNTHPYIVACSLNRVGYALDDINHFSEAEHYYKLALDLFRQLEEEKNDTYKDDIAMVLNNLAGTYWKTNHFDNAIKILNETLTTYRQLADKNPDAYLPYVAMTLNNLAALHYSTNQYKEAEEEYHEALTTYRQLAAQNPYAYLPDVAMTLNNLAALHRNTNQLQEAEEEYKEALTTYRQLAAQNPDAYLSYVAATLNNLANLHSDTNQLYKAEEEYKEALTTYRQLADKNPDAFLPYVATTLNNLAGLHYSTNQYKEAEEEYKDVLSIRQKLADKNPDAYLPDVAMTLNNLANLHSDTNQLDNAENEFNEALTIRRQLADKNPDAYLPDVAQTLYNMALLHLVRKEYPAAEAAAQESLEKYRIMAEKSHAAFDPYVKKAEVLLEVIRKAKEADA